jgi:cytochrome P450
VYAELTPTISVGANIIGIVIGAIPTLSKASCLAVEELLRRPTAFAAARTLAQAGNEAGVADHLWEALRFNPVNPILYRRAAKDTNVGDTAVAANTMVLAANLFADQVRDALDPKAGRRA